MIAVTVLAACNDAGKSTGSQDNVEPGPSSGNVWPLGIVTTTAATDAGCPPNSVCRGIQVTCQRVSEPAPAFIAVATPTGSPRGVAVFTTGSGGSTWALTQGERTSLLDNLRADGFVVVQLRWAGNWLVSSPGNDAGTAHLGCRPATAFKWIHDNYFQPLGIARSSSGRCGFCITGNSGGATQVSYALSHYGLETILDGVMPTGGPPHAALTKACLLRPGENAYWYPDDTRHFIDRGFGFFDGNGPCARQDPAFTSRWNEESVATGGSDYNHPRTRVHFILGDSDIGMRAPNADYVARLRAEGSPWVTLELALNTQHSVLGSDIGRAAVRSAFLATR